MEAGLNIAADTFTEVFQSRNKVQGLTHDFYKYPARFNPAFVRFILNNLSDPGDWVFDPFMGGGTTLVESISSGRPVVGSDINELARFVARVKTTPLSSQDISKVHNWVERVKRLTSAGQFYDVPMHGTIRNMPTELHPFFATAIRLVDDIKLRRRREFARCALLRAGQWALDARTRIPTMFEVCEELERRVIQMVRGLDTLVISARNEGIKKNKITGYRQIRAYSAANQLLANNLSQRDVQPKLVITSPPYPGVHMLYHRWQVLGRRETPAPYWIANLRDGHGESYYTMGGRSGLGLGRYFDRLSASFVNLKQIVHPEAYVIQLISFSDTTTQLPLYLEIMERAGFTEISVGNIKSRLIRMVPNRRWYNQEKYQNDASKEILLVHQVEN